MKGKKRATPHHSCTSCDRKNLDDIFALDCIGKHMLCAGCMVEALMKSKMKRFQRFRCPCCTLEGYDSVVNTHHHDWKGGRKNRMHEAPIPHPERDPVRHYTSLPSSRKEDHMQLSLSYQNKGDERYISLFLSTKQGPATKNEEEALQTFLSYLGLVVFGGVRDLDSDASRLPIMSPFQYKRWILHCDNRPQTRYIYSLFTGSVSWDDDCDKVVTEPYLHPGTRGKLFACAAVADIALRLADHRNPQRLQLMIGDQMETIPQSYSIHELMSNFRLSVCLSTVRNSSYTNINKRVTKGIKLHPRGHASFSLDNYDLKGRRRGKPFKDTWTVITCQNHPENRVKNEGAYGTEDEPPWDPHDGIEWSDLVDAATSDDQKNELADEVWGIHDCHWLLFSNRELQILQTIQNANIASQDECQEMQANQAFEGAGSISVTLGVVLQQPTFHTQEEFRNGPVGGAGGGHEQDDGFSRGWTLYELGNLSVLTPFHANPSANDVIENLATCFARCIDDLMESMDPEDNEFHPDGESIQGKLVGVCVDGGPAETWIRVKTQLQNSGDTRFDNVEFFSGPLHLMINSLRQLNKLFRPTHGHFISLTRRTARRFDYAMKVPDPRDIFHELFEHTVAVLRNASDHYNAATPEPQRSERGLYDFIKEKSKSDALRMVIDLHCKFARILLMLRDSWRSGNHGNIKLYHAAMRYLIILEMITHSTNYIRTNFYFLRWWHCASTCQKKIFDHFLWTRWSPNGSVQPSDEQTEKVIGDGRNITGKTVRPGQEAKIYAEFPQIPDKVAANARARPNRMYKTLWDDGGTIPYHERDYELGEVFVTSYNELDRLNIFGEGEVNVVHLQGRGDESDSGDEDNDSDSENSERERNRRNRLRAPSGDVLSAELTSGGSIGETLRNRYGVFWEIERFKEVTRNEQVIKLPLLAPRAGGISEDKQVLLTKFTSIIPDELEGLKTKITVKEILSELEELSPYYADIIEIPKYTKTTRKKILIGILCGLRLTYFAEFPESKQDRVDFAESQAEQASKSTRLQRTQEMENAPKLHSLHPDASLH